MDATSRVRDVALKQAIQQKTHLESVFANPLAGLSLDQVRDLGEDFAKDYELSEDGGSDTIIPLFRTAAVLSQNNEIWRIRQTDSNPNGPKLDLSDKDIVCLREEETNKLKQPLDLYLIIAACALSAAVQGWNEYGDSTPEFLWSAANNLQNSP